MAKVFIDPAALLTACGCDAAILAKIVAALTLQVPASLEALRDHAVRGDTAALRRDAHKLHGMIATASSVAGALAEALEHGGSINLIDQLAEVSRALLVELESVSVYSLQRAARPVL